MSLSRRCGVLSAPLEKYFILAVFWLISSAGWAQNDGLKNSSPAFPPEPRNLAEASGLFIGSANQLAIFKSSECGYALKRSVPSYREFLETQIIPAFAPEAREKVRYEILAVEGDVSAQSRSVYEGLYRHYRKVENQDHATTCGIMNSAFLTLYKLSAEAFERARLR